MITKTLAILALTSISLLASTVQPPPVSYSPDHGIPYYKYEDFLKYITALQEEDTPPFQYKEYVPPANKPVSWNQIAPPSVSYDSILLNDSAAPTPEPSAYVLMGSGLLFIGMVRRRLNRS